MNRRVVPRGRDLTRFTVLESFVGVLGRFEVLVVSVEVASADRTITLDLRVNPGPRDSSEQEQFAHDVVVDVMDGTNLLPQLSAGIARAAPGFAAAAHHSVTYEELPVEILIAIRGFQDTISIGLR